MEALFCSFGHFFQSQYHTLVASALSALALPAQGRGGSRQGHLTAESSILSRPSSLISAEKATPSSTKLCKTKPISEPHLPAKLFG